jgi:hypothetical protein
MMAEATTSRNNEIFDVKDSPVILIVLGMNISLYLLLTSLYVAFQTYFIALIHVYFGYLKALNVDNYFKKSI